MNATKSPLYWPPGWPRTPDHKRTRSGFGKGFTLPSFDAQRRELYAELGRMRAREIVLSTNLALRLDGEPRASQGEPRDPGVAVYWVSKEGAEHVLACDRYDRIGCNLRAIVKHIDALRGIARWGCGSLEQAFRGYAALPAGEVAIRREWWEVLDLEGPGASIVAITSAFKRRARECHPDAGGDRRAWDELVRARDEGIKERARHAGAA